MNSPHQPNNVVSRRSLSIRLMLPACLVIAGLFLMAESCTGTGGTGFNPIPGPAGTPTPCATGSQANCPPPSGPLTAKCPTSSSPAPLCSVETSYFSLYFNPGTSSGQIWGLDSQNSNSNNEVTLVRQTDFGQVTAQFFANSVSAGTSASSLLSSWTSKNIDPSKFSGFQDFGPILGAEIGFNAGAGEQYGGYADLPNAPNSPIFIQVMSSVKNSTGIIFVVVSPLDTSNPDPTDPTQVLSGSYDHLINTLTWR